jgi:hypothetical protein
MSSSAATHLDFIDKNQNITNYYKSPNYQKNRDSSQLQKSTLGTYAEYPSHARKMDTGVKPQQLQKRQKNKRVRKAGKLLPGEKIASCQLAVAPEYQYVTLNVNPADCSSRWHGLVCCQSYSCPHCAAARSEHDRHELTVALAAATKRGWHPVMVTPTMSHNMFQPLDINRDQLANAFDRCFSGRWWQDVQEEYQLQCKVKMWETTFGKNGWHPHMHILIWSAIELNDYALAGLQKTLALRWVEILSKLGRWATLEHGLTVEAADSKIADYIAKWGHEPSEQSWGVESEMTKSHLKKNRLDGMTPFELLGAAAGESDRLEKLSHILKGQNREQLENRAGRLYVEYFKAFKGKPRLHWGKTKDLLGLDRELELYAQAEAEAQQPTSPELEPYPMVMIERGCEWVKVTGGYKGEDLRCDLSEVCETLNPYLVRQWLADRQIVATIPGVAWERFNQLGGRTWHSLGDDWRPVAGGRLS